MITYLIKIPITRVLDQLEDDRLPNPGRKARHGGEADVADAARLGERLHEWDPIQTRGTGLLDGHVDLPLHRRVSGQNKDVVAVDFPVGHRSLIVGIETVAGPTCFRCIVKAHTSWHLEHKVCCCSEARGQRDEDCTRKHDCCE